MFKVDFAEALDFVLNRFKVLLRPNPLGKANYVNIRACFLLLQNTQNMKRIVAYWLNLDDSNCMI